MIRALLGQDDRHVRVWQHGAGMHVEVGNPTDKQTLLNLSGIRSTAGHTLAFTPTKPHMALEDTLNLVNSDSKCR